MGEDYGYGNDDSYVGDYSAPESDMSLDQQVPLAQDNSYYDSSDASSFLQNQNWDFGNYQMPDNQGMQSQWGANYSPMDGMQGGAMYGSDMEYNPMAGYKGPQGGYGGGVGGQDGGISSFLSQLFSGGGALGGKGGQGLVAGLGALMEGRQNKQQAKNMQQVVQQQQQRTSPFDVQSTGASQMGANSMRDAMQQKLAAAMQDPYSAPIVKSQVEQIQKAQAIKDAAAGRRSNSSTSDPAMMAAQAKVAQDYINSLQNPAGANINPNSQGLEALLQAQRNNTNGYASPIMSALGYNASVNTAQNNQQAQIEQLRALLQGGR